MKRTNGFTLIEIVLVLAIAGLLLIVVFLAVSGAQRSRRDYQRKQDLAHIKAQWALFQQISADTKDLDDIPHYWPQAQALGLPAVQYTARDVRSGLLFWAFAEKRSAAASAVFASRIQQHLHRYGVSLRDLAWQTDNGSEFK